LTLISLAVEPKPGVLTDLLGLVPSGLSEIPLYREKLFEQAESVLLVPFTVVCREEFLEGVLGGPAIVRAMFIAIFILEDDIYV
jgi:hypothetical protein